MNKAISLALIAAGMVLGGFGLKEMHSMESNFSRIFTGGPTDHSIWMVIGGVVIIVYGLMSGMPGVRKN